MGPETTCIGPDLSVRQSPTVIFVMPLRPVGNNAACLGGTKNRASASYTRRGDSSLGNSTGIIAAIKRSHAAAQQQH